MLNKNIIYNIKTNIILAILLLFPLSYFYIKDLNFFVSDIGLRYLQITQLIEHQWQTLAIDYPLRYLDPTFEYFSYYRAYGIINDEIYFFISPFFPLLVSFLYLWLGSAGLPIIPVIGGVTTAWGTYKLAEISQLRYPLLAFWGTILATPVLFYSLVLWDHTLATALTTLAVYGVVKGIKQERQTSIVWAGIALGLAVNQRPEAYVFTISLGMILLIVSWPKWQAAMALAIGGVTSALPLWIWQYFWVGHPLGMATAPNLFRYSAREEYPFPPIVLPKLLQKSWLLFHVQEGSILSLLIALLIVIGTAMIILTLRLAHHRGRRYLLAALGLSMAGYLLTCIIALFGALKGLLSTFPLIALSLTYIDAEKISPQNKKSYQFIFLTTFIFLLIMFITWPASGGLQWGTRYLLSSAPLLIYLALFVYQTYSYDMNLSWAHQFNTTAMILLFFSLLIQILSVWQLDVSRRDQLDAHQLVNSLSTTIIITNVGHASAFLTGVPDKEFLYVRDSQSLKPLLKTLAENNLNRVAIIPDKEDGLIVPEQVDDILIHEIETYIYSLERTDSK